MAEWRLFITLSVKIKIFFAIDIGTKLNESLLTFKKVKIKNALPI
jgi:hypothetical protein